MNRNNRTVLQLVGVVIFMGAMAWVAVPFYSWFCRVTGYAGTTNVATTTSDVVLDEKIRVRFDANVDANMGWSFKPMQREIVLNIGDSGLAFYEAINNNDYPVTGTASYNVAPTLAGYYFNKIECFCFTEQVLQPGERMEMPVTFFVDPDLVKDQDAGRIRDITLSYTFHRTDPPAEDKPTTRASLDAKPEQTVN